MYRREYENIGENQEESERIRMNSRNPKIIRENAIESERMCKECKRIRKYPRSEKIRE